MKLKKVRIGDLFKLQKGKKALMTDTFIEGKTSRLIQIEDLRSNNEIKYCLPDNKTVTCKKDDILIAWDGANAGTVGYGLEGVIGSTIARLYTDQENVYTPYFARYLQMKSSYLRQRATGATIPHIQKDILMNLQVPFLPYSEQVKISSILDKAQSLIGKRKQAIAKLDELIVSVFFTFFGDGHFFEKVNLRECLEIPLNAGWSPVCSEDNKGIPVFSLANLTKEGLSTKITKFYDGGLPTKGADLKPGDILISRSNTRELVGRVGLYEGFPDPVIYPDLMIRIRVKKDYLNPIYFLYYLISISKLIRNMAHGSNESMVKISQSKLLSLPVIIPPKDLQDKFVEQVQQIKTQKRKMQQQLEQLEQNFNSLLHRAFTGQLTIMNLSQ